MRCMQTHICTQLIPIRWSSNPAKISTHLCSRRGMHRHESTAARLHVYQQFPATTWTSPSSSWQGSTRKGDPKGQDIWWHDPQQQPEYGPWFKSKTGPSATNCQRKTSKIVSDWTRRSMCSNTGQRWLTVPVIVISM